MQELSLCTHSLSRVAKRAFEHFNRCSNTCTKALCARANNCSAIIALKREAESFETRPLYSMRGSYRGTPAKESKPWADALCAYLPCGSLLSSDYYRNK